MATVSEGTLASWAVGRLTVPPESLPTPRSGFRYSEGENCDAFWWGSWVQIGLRFSIMMGTSGDRDLAFGHGLLAFGYERTATHFDG